MDRFPRVGDLIRFDKDWEVQDYFGGSWTMIPKGSLLELVKIEIHESEDPSFAPCTFYIPFKDQADNNKWKILKFPYSDRSDVLTAIPNTKAAEVLFGPKT